MLGNVASGSLASRIEGSPFGRALREFATGSALFPILNLIRALSLEGGGAVFRDSALYLLFASAAVQAWLLGRRVRLAAWQRALGNLIAPASYTCLDLLIEGPAELVANPYHWVYWIFSLIVALLSLAESRRDGTRAAAATVGISLARVLLFPSLYMLSEAALELPERIDLAALSGYWFGQQGHLFILLGSLVFGLLLGLSEAQLQRYAAFLRGVAHRHRQISEWSLRPDLLERSLADGSVLEQRRADRAVLFMDVRGFTRWTEGKPPEQVIANGEHVLRAG